MAEIPELDPSSSFEALNSEEKSRGSERISVSDHINTFEKPDSFVIDMDAFSSAIHKDPTNANSRIADTGTLVGPCAPEKPAEMAVGSMDYSINPHVYQQIAMTTNNISGNPTESKCSITRRNSFRRPSSWALDPKRVLLFFATLSSMGTMLLIYFTLTSKKQSSDEYRGDWKQ
ncbi:unnamed protein product [Sphenostylis stenocarpa]|uniref:Uncharacterized protein n=1 Tax=Sphenostylis stenocarpa TaxID=92480 RepID=A0AA86RZB4_9FABA|nr:unnamed protein product [Sphenostylis stenocarpa]